MEPGIPAVEDHELETLSKAVQKLASARRIKASTQAVLTGMLAAVSQGLAPVSLPRPQAWVEPESEEEPEESEEEEETGGMVAAGPGEPIAREECVQRVVGDGGGNKGRMRRREGSGRSARRCSASSRSSSRWARRMGCTTLRRAWSCS